jgi:ABC-type branched-subunit amino acid transport system substrate-binding protein
MWSAAQLAIDKANRQGGYRGLPFRLVPIWSQNQWGSGIAELARSIYTDNLWAIIGSVDGPSTHLAEQLVVKARLTLINPISSDKTVNLANVPWMFSCLPGEHLQVPVLAEGIAEAGCRDRVTLVSGTDHDSRVFARELMNHLPGTGLRLGHHFDLDSRQDHYSVLVDQILDADSQVVIVLAGPSESALVVKQLRSNGYKGRIFGGPQMGRADFLREAGWAALGVTFPKLVSIPDQDLVGRKFEQESAALSDYRGFQTYDAITLLTDAIKKAGLNRARIRDAVRDLSPWQGISGTIVWDALGQNKRQVQLATILNSHFENLRHPE